MSLCMLDLGIRTGMHSFGCYELEVQENGSERWWSVAWNLGYDVSIKIQVDLETYLELSSD